MKYPSSNFNTHLSRSAITLLAHPLTINSGILSQGTTLREIFILIVFQDCGILFLLLTLIFPSLPSNQFYVTISGIILFQISTQIRYAVITIYAHV